MRLFVKNMVSIRCKMIVKAELKNLGLHYIVVELGEIEISEELSSATRTLLHTALLKFGLELMDDQNSILIDKIKKVIVGMIYYADELPLKNSVYISEQLQHDYPFLTKLFSDGTGGTIEDHIIHHKVERVKELLLYENISITQIAYKLNYNSVSHLSAQFKKMTGLTPSFFKKMEHKRIATSNQ